jgi:prophage antirepressor-like protein
MEALKQLVTRICQSQKITKKDDENIKGIMLKITNLTLEQTKILENLKSGYVKKDDIEQLTKLFDDVNKQIDDNNSVETEMVSTQINSCDVEDTLDKTVTKYNSFSEKHPMDYVNYDETHSNYRVRQTGQSFASKKSDVVCKKMLEIFYANLRKSFQEIGVDKKIPIKYAGKNILVYNTVDNPLFDIQHIFSLLGLEQASISDKYDTFKKYISHFGVQKNQFGGYFIREFVSFKTMCQIIMSSNKKFAKKFKEDVSEILDNLRQNGQLTLSQNTLSVNTEHSQLMETHINSIIDSGKEIQSYDNPVYNDFVKTLIINGAKISITPYMNNHVMYMFVTTLKDPLEKNRILCKIGYTYDIVTRIASLRSGYGCKFYQIAFKIVKSEQYEKEFHKMIKTLHHDLHVPTKCKNKDKDEIYVFDKILYNEFMNIKDGVETKQLHNPIETPNDDILVKLEQKITDDTPQKIKDPYINKLPPARKDDGSYTGVRYKCAKCNKIFKLKGDYKRHLNRKIPCHMKDRQVVNKDVNKKDISVTHSTALTCEYCKKKFTRKDSLGRHLIDRCKVKKAIDEPKEQLFRKMLEEHKELIKQLDDHNKCITKLKKQIKFLMEKYDDE